VFTTRVDTIFGATSVQLAPQHPLVAAFTAADPALKAQVDELIEQQKKAREAGDLGAIEKHGVPTGALPSIPITASACRSGWRTTFWPTTAPAPS
jgi:leucyl-tRNA synthetase